MYHLPYRNVHKLVHLSAKSLYIYPANLEENLIIKVVLDLVPLFSFLIISLNPDQMARFSPNTIFYVTILVVVSIISVVVPQSNAALTSHYYGETCPQAEKIIFQTVYNASIYDPKVPARILRMFFHDCFIRVSIY